MEGNVLSAAQKDLERISEPGPNAKPEEKAEYERIKDNAKLASENLRQHQINMGQLASVPNIADITVKNIKQQFTNDAGVFDEKSALDSVEKITAPSAVKQQIRQKLSAEPPNRPPEQLDAVVKALEGYSKEEQIKHINSLPSTGNAYLSKSDKQTLTQRINSGSVPNVLSGVGPGLTVIQTAEGQYTSIANIGANNYVANNPGSKIIGKGTKGDTPEEKEDFSNRME